MFESYTGAVKDENSKVYLRPETAQGIFLNFKNVLDSTRVRVPFGIAQVGKAFRNEVNPRNFIFRSRDRVGNLSQVVEKSFLLIP